MTATRKAQPAPKNILVIDVGGSHVKCLVTGQTTRRKFVSGPGLTPQQMVQGVLEIAADWRFDAVSMGYPGVVHDGAPSQEPHHLATGWVGFDFQAAFNRPVRIVNDAAMQALGSYQGGKMLFLGLGTGLGSALIVRGEIVAMELGHLRRSKHHDYEDLLGKRGYKRLGKKKWRRKVDGVVQGFAAALLPDEIVVGGGKAKKLKKLPPRTRRGSNAAAFVGGFRMWEEQAPSPCPDAYEDLS
jgi:predicted NBD/HSP70 family sugar kinase